MFSSETPDHLLDLIFSYQCTQFQAFVPYFGDSQLCMVCVCMCMDLFV